MLFQALCIISYPLVNSNLSYSPETLNSGQKQRLFEPCDLEILQVTLKNNRASLLCYFKLCVSFHTHWWIETGVTVGKRPIWVKFNDFKSHATLKFDRWPCKTIGHLFYATSSFMHHFIPIGKSKFELQSGNAQFGSKASIFLALWPRNFTDDPKKNRASLLFYFKLCVSFRTHCWIQIGVTIWKPPNWVTFNDF